MKRFMNKKVAAIAAAVGLTLGLGGAAFAYFTTTGSGDGAATTGTGVTVTLVQDTSVIAADLVPGGPSQTIVGHQNNSDGDTEYIGTVSVTFTGTSWNPAVDGYTCSAADYTWVGNTVNTDEASGSATAETIPTAGQFTLGTLSFKDNAAQIQDSCKGQVLDLHFTSN